MTKFSYNRESYDNWKKSKNVSEICQGLFFSVFLILYFSLGFSMKDLWEGNTAELEYADNGVKFGIGVMIGCFLTVLLAYKMYIKSSVILKQIEMCELDLHKKYILVTYPSRQYGDKLAVKCFLRLSYDEIQKIDWEERFEKGQRTNFTIYHKNGCIELLIEHPEWAATAIDESIKMSKGLKNVPAEESVLQEDLDAIGEKPENESDHRGEFESGISESAISEEKQFESQPCKTLVCPKCWEDLSVPIGSESFVCPHCGNKMEFPSL